MIGVLQSGDDDTSITFEASADRLRTWQDARRSASARWAKIDVYAGKPKKEFLGPGLSKIDLSVRLDIERGVVPRDEIRKMRDLMNTGAVLQLTVGGELVGDFTIDSVDETWRRLSRDGVLTTAVVSISLEEYS